MALTGPYGPVMSREEVDRTLKGLGDERGLRSAVEVAHQHAAELAVPSAGQQSDLDKSAEVRLASVG